MSAAAFAAIGLIAVSCGKKDGSDSANPAIQKMDDVTARIVFYDPDTVAAHYTLIEELNAQINADLQSYQAEERSKVAELQRMQQKIADKMRNNGYLTEESYNKDVQDYQAKEQQAQNYLANLQQNIDQKTREQSKMLRDSLNNFLKDFNAVHKFDAILQAGTQNGELVDSSVDITKAVYEGLNERYQVSQKGE